MKKIARAIISMGVVLAFAGCSWEVPQSVSVKTQADYNFSIGTFEKELDNSMDMSSMMGDAGEGNDKIQTLDYFPGKLDKNTQHYLLEVKVLEAQLLAADSIPDAETLNTIFASSDTVDLTSLASLPVPVTLETIPANAVSTGFNPATMLSGMKEALGEDMSGKISFASVPMYLYCETAENLSATATLELYYGDDPADARSRRDGVEPIPILPGGVLSNKPKPDYQKEGNTATVNLAEKACIGDSPLEIKSLINNTNDAIQEDDDLCISYSIAAPTGSVTRAEVEAGIPLTIYAVIDLPVKFEVLDEVKLDISEMTKGSEGSSSSSSSDDSSSSGKEEFSKYLEVIDTVTIKYVAYKLPFYSTSGMKLGIDMVGDGTNKYMQYAKIAIVDKNKNITDADKGVIELKQATIQKMKDISNFSPKIQLLMEKDSVFSLPREKAVEMNLEMGFTTDGIVKVN